METSRSRQGSPLLRPPTQASAEEAAAIIAALEQFLADTAPTPPTPRAAAAEPAPSPWQQAALAEGVARGTEASGSWIGLP